MNPSNFYELTQRSGIRPMREDELSQALNDSEPSTPVSAYYADHSGAIVPPAKPEDDPTIDASWYYNG